MATVPRRHCRFVMEFEQEHQRPRRLAHCQGVSAYAVAVYIWLPFVFEMAAAIVYFVTLIVTHSTMNLQTFERQYRERMQNILERLQSLNLTIAQMESGIEEVAGTVQALSYDVEVFIAEQRSSK